MDNSNKNNPAALPKITRPDSSDPVQRTRLFQRLDQIDNTLCWISGPPGAGKTTLVSSYLARRPVRYLWYQLDPADTDPAAFFHYLSLAAERAHQSGMPQLPALTPEYLPGLAGFTRRYAEHLTSRLESPAILVFDNYEQVPQDCPLHEVVRTLASHLPHAWRLMVLSRAAPPAAFALMRLYGEIALLDGESLNLTADEAHDFAARRAGTTVDAARVDHLHGLTQGWIAGFNLLLSDHLQTGDSGLGDAQQLLFDYFATELFARFAAPIHNALLRTALLPAMTVPQARQLTGDPHIGAVLADLQKHNCFIMRRGDAEPIYEFHALFHAFLRNRASQTINPESWRSLQREAASLLEKAGQYEAAVNLLRTAHDWSGLAELAIREAPGLISTGRHTTLSAWLDAVPAEAMDDSAWFWYWFGMARGPFAPTTARGHFERAYRLFERDGSAAGQYSAWAGLMQTFLYEWRDFTPVDPWIAAYERLRAQHPVFPSAAVELHTLCAFVTLMFRRPQHPLVKGWADRAEEILDPANNPDLSILLASYVLLYQGWMGDITRMRAIIARVEGHTGSDRVTPMTYILWRAAGIGTFHAMRGEQAAFLHHMDEALEMGRRTGLRVWDLLLHATFASVALTNGDPVAIRAGLKATQANLRNHGFIDGTLYHHLHSNAAAQLGDWRAALDHARTGLAMALAAGVPFPEATCHIDAARASLHLGVWDEARRHLDSAWALARAMGSRTLEYLCGITEARTAFCAGDDHDGMLHLTAALQVSHAMDGPLREFSGPATVVPLYVRALESGIGVEHVRTLIRRRGFTLPDPASGPDLWPWAIRVHTLGHFEVLRDDLPLNFPGRYQQKPLELLQCLCAFGGESVDQQKVSDALWPDADGDAAEQALRTTLHRLRKLLQYEGAIHHENRHLSLNTGLVWCDCRAFLWIAKRPEAADRKALQHAFDRYRGQFLEGTAAPWAVTCRESLRAHYLRLTERLGDLLEQQEEWLCALDCYHRSLDIEPTAEHIHRRVMQVHVRLGQPAAALAAYRRCRLSLQTQLGIEPAPATEALHQSLK